MGKSFRYNINKESSKKRNSRFGRKGKRCFRDYLKTFFCIVITLLILYLIYNIYTSIVSIKTDDILGETSSIYELHPEGAVKRTLIVYEDVSLSEDTNLFLLSVIFNEETSDILIYKFPGDLYIKEDEGNKYISVRNLTYAGSSYLYDGKYAYVLRQISLQMGMDFDSYVWIESDMASSFFGRDLGVEDAKSIFSKFSGPRLIMGYRNAEIISNSLHSNMNFRVK